MRNAGKKILLLGLACALCLLSAVQAQASGVLTLKPGESTIREFALFDEFNPRKLGPMELYLVVGTGDNDTQTLLGDLTINVKPTVTKTFGSRVDYKLIGFVYPLGAAMPTFISVTATVGASSTGLTKVVSKISAIYGFALLGVYVKTIDGDVNLPVQFALTVGWAQYVKK